jgi:prepilin-type N-terminal cleavage/methylation domain-containing protein
VNNRFTNKDMTAQSTQQINTSKGFTLIELLVTIAIIAIISVVAVALFGNVQANARDAKRRSELEALANALEVNRNSTTGYYSTLTKSQLAGGVWPGQVAGSGTAALDPQTYPYCIVTSTTGTASGPSAVTGWATTPACATTGGGSMINDSLTAFSNVNAWVVCTRLESGGTASVYCKGNSQ